MRCVVKEANRLWAYKKCLSGVPPEWMIVSLDADLSRRIMNVLRLCALMVADQVPFVANATSRSSRYGNQ